MNIYGFWPPFRKVTDRWIGSEKGVLHFSFTEIGCPSTVPGDLKFITDSLHLFGLNKTFSNSEI